MMDVEQDDDNLTVGCSTATGEGKETNACLCGFSNTSVQLTACLDILQDCEFLKGSTYITRACLRGTLAKKGRIAHEAFP